MNLFTLISDFIFYDKLLEKKSFKLIYNNFFNDQQLFDDFFSLYLILAIFYNFWPFFLQGLYRGFTISCVGIFIYRGMYFGLYDSLKPILLGENAPLLQSFLLGWGVTIFSGLMSYPIDTVRRRMMMTSGSAVKYKGSVDCAVQVIKSEGFMSLMKGAGK